MSRYLNSRHRTTHCFEVISMPECGINSVLRDLNTLQYAGMNNSPIARDYVMISIDPADGITLIVEIMLGGDPCKKVTIRQPEMGKEWRQNVEEKDDYWSYDKGYKTDMLRRIFPDHDDDFLVDLIKRQSFPTYSNIAMCWQKGKYRIVLDL